MSAEQRTSGDEGTVLCEGNLTVNRAEEMKSAFIQALQNANEVTITFTHVTDVDLSYLQLLCSVHRSALRLHKQVRFQGGLPEILKDTAEAAGYLRLKGCKLDSEKNCLWMTVAGACHG